MGQITGLVKSSHENARNKGFYEDVDSVLTILKNVDERLVAVANDAFIAQRLMLITSELGEGLEGLRYKKRFDKDGCLFDVVGISIIEDDVKFTETFEFHVKDTVEDELADAAIRLFDLSGFISCDLESHILAKARYNSLRAKMHGGKGF